MGQGVLLERGGVWEQRLLDGPIHNKEGGGGGGVYLMK